MADQTIAFTPSTVAAALLPHAPTRSVADELLRMVDTRDLHLVTSWPACGLTLPAVKQPARRAEWFARHAQEPDALTRLAADGRSTVLEALLDNPEAAAFVQSAAVYRTAVKHRHAAVASRIAGSVPVEVLTDPTTGRVWSPEIAQALADAAPRFTHADLDRALDLLTGLDRVATPNPAGGPLAAALTTAAVRLGVVDRVMAAGHPDLPEFVLALLTTAADDGETLFDLAGLAAADLDELAAVVARRTDPVTSAGTSTLATAPYVTPFPQAAATHRSPLPGWGSDPQLAVLSVFTTRFDEVEAGEVLAVLADEPHLLSLAAFAPGLADTDPVREALLAAVEGPAGGTFACTKRAATLLDSGRSWTPAQVARLAAAAAVRTVFVDWAAGKFASRPGPGDVDTALDELLVLVPNWTRPLLYDLWWSAIRAATASEAREVLAACGFRFDYRLYPTMGWEALGGALGVVTSAMPADPDVWQTFASLAAQWDGSLAELAATARAVAA